MIGELYRAGQVYVKEEQIVYDHDFANLATGVVIPHGLYDEKRNIAYLTFGTSKDTSEFAGDNVVAWWESDLKHQYPQATKLILRCDGGGSNSSRAYIVKYDFQQVANRIGLPVQIQHYPPYCSKYNRIEHRVFPHLTRKWQGVIFTNYAIVKELAEQTTTKTGLRICVRMNEHGYQTGRRAEPDDLAHLNIAYHERLGKWNYTFYPQSL